MVEKTNRFSFLKCIVEAMSFDLKIMNADDVPMRGVEAVCVRPQVLYHFIWRCVFTLIFSGIIACFFAHYFHEHIVLPVGLPEQIYDFYELLEVPAAPYVTGVLSLFFLMFMKISASMHRKSKMPRSWLIYATSDGIYVQYRSFLNQNFDLQDDTVIYIPASLVSWMREVQYFVKGHDSTAYMKGVEISVKRLDQDLIQGAVSAERLRRSSSGARWNDFPVSVSEDNIIRVKFSVMKPKPKRFIEAVGRWYMTKEKAKLGNVNVRQRFMVNHKWEENDIRRAIEAGSVIEAIKIARRVRKMGLKEAKDYVESLRTK